jgi:hypothetical protein
VFSSMRVGLTAFVLALASFGIHPPPAGAVDAAAVLERLEAARPTWLPSLDTCPADVMPARETKNDLHEGRCTSTLEACLDHCRGGDANDCYASALVLQRVNGNSAIPQALFLKACALGVVSGCTNRAAGMGTTSSLRSPCIVRTFAAACEHNDPWACTMLGAHLVRGIGGIAKDHNGAREVLSRACRLGETDEACQFAKALLKEIGD